MSDDSLLLMIASTANRDRKRMLNDELRVRICEREINK